MKNSKLVLLVFLSAFMVALFIYAEHVGAIAMGSIIAPIVLFTLTGLFFLFNIKINYNNL